jgi:hypothetical protein
MTAQSRQTADVGGIPATALDALADEIAGRLEARLGPRLALVAATEAVSEASPAARYWSAGQIAGHYGVTVGFVYQHADELGCVRLGGGRRARLRFDPDIVRERWAGLGEVTPEVAPQRRAPTRKRRVRAGRERSVELLEFDAEQ